MPDGKVRTPAGRVSSGTDVSMCCLTIRRTDCDHEKTLLNGKQCRNIRRPVNRTSHASKQCQTKQNNYFLKVFQKVEEQIEPAKNLRDSRKRLGLHEDSWRHIAAVRIASTLGIASSCHEILQFSIASEFGNAQK